MKAETASQRKTEKNAFFESAPEADGFGGALYPFLFLSVLQFFSLCSADAVDMAFKISAVKEFRQNKLFVSRNGAGIEADLFLKGFYKFFRQNHVTDTQRRRDRL